MVEMQLPTPVKSIQAIDSRKSIRSYTNTALSLEQLSSLLWAAYGFNDIGKRTVPSAGGLYPLGVHLFIGRNGVENTPAGLYQYTPKSHGLSVLAGGDFREEVAAASVRQMWMAQAPLIVLITITKEIYLPRYGQRGHRYAHIEAGCVAQNLSLQAVTLGLGTAIVGAFKGGRLAELAMLPEGTGPILVMSVGVASG